MRTRFTVKDTAVFILFAALGGGNAPSAFAAAPGGVTGNLQLWLKADAGTDTVVDGASVNVWTDQSPNGYVATSTNMNPPTYRNATSNKLNFNPVIDFDGTNDGLNLAGNFVFSTGTGLTIFAIADPDDASTQTTQFVLDFGNITIAGYGMIYGSPTRGVYGSTNSGGSLMLETSNPRGEQPTLVTAKYDFGTDERLFVNGALATSSSITLTQLTAAEINENSAPAATAGPVTIGRQSKTNNITNDGGRFFNGRIAEVAVYDTDAAQSDRDKIESYLALKWGLTLNQSGAGRDYVSSTGKTIFAATTTMSEYTSNIIGIGRDDNSGLNQTSSRSTESGGTVLLSGASSLGNMDFLLTGHNGVATATVATTSIPLTVGSRLSRTGRIDETDGGVAGDGVGTVDLSFDMTAVMGRSTVGEAVLLADANDADFTDAVVTQPTSLSGGILLFNDINPTDGIYFTLGLGAIGNLVWRDLDGDGVADGGANEAGISDVTLSLYLDNGDSAFSSSTDTLRATTTTASDGSWSFIGLDSGSYWVDLTDDNDVLDGFTRTSSTATPELIVVDAGENYATADYGFQPAAGTIVLSKVTLEGNEGGNTLTYTVSLSTEPIGPVDVSITVPGGEAAVSPATLSFSVANFATPQTVTVTITDDNEVEGTHTDTITHTASSTDSNYNGDTASAALTVSDNESGPSGGSSSRRIAIDGESVNIPRRCGRFLTGFIFPGRQNSLADVKKVQAFLRVYEGAKLTPSGMYGTKDKNAIIAFQEKYANEILKPWGLSAGTGNVFQTTQAAINKIYCKSRSAAVRRTRVLPKSIKDEVARILFR